MQYNNPHGTNASEFSFFIENGTFLIDKSLLLNCVGACEWLHLYMGPCASSLQCFQFIFWPSEIATFRKCIICRRCHAIYVFNVIVCYSKSMQRACNAFFNTKCLHILAVTCLSSYLMLPNPVWNTFCISKVWKLYREDEVLQCFHLHTCCRIYKCYMQ